MPRPSASRWPGFLGVEITWDAVEGHGPWTVPKQIEADRLEAFAALQYHVSLRRLHQSSKDQHVLLPPPRSGSSSAHRPVFVPPQLPVQRRVAFESPMMLAQSLP
eukprot:1628530-Pyramimonas_sp.AAC.1